LLREDEWTYHKISNVFYRSDAAVHLRDELVGYMWDTFLWIPTLQVSDDDVLLIHGINRWGQTIINHQGALIFQQICLSWAQLFSQGPEQLILSGPTSISWPFEEEERTLNEKQAIDLLSPTQLVTDRDLLVQNLRLLALFGAQAAVGEHFILHYGI
jgi:hypothetical protein